MEDDVSKEPPWRDELTITKRSTIETLLDLKAMRFCGPFLRGPRTLSEAAGELGRPTSTMAYWIGKLERAGVIERLDPVRRNGMAMPRYRALARQFFVPFASIPPGLTTEVMDSGRQRILDQFLDGLDDIFTADRYSGIQFRASGVRGVEIDVREPEPSRDGIPWVDFWGELHLTRDQARQLSTELREVLERYRLDDAGPHAYVAHVGVAPAPKRRRRSATHT